MKLLRLNHTTVTEYEIRNSKEKLLYRVKKEPMEQKVLFINPDGQISGELKGSFRSWIFHDKEHNLKETIHFPLLGRTVKVKFGHNHLEGTFGNSKNSLLLLGKNGSSQISINKSNDKSYQIEVSEDLGSIDAVAPAVALDLRYNRKR